MGTKRGSRVCGMIRRGFSHLLEAIRAHAP